MISRVLSGREKSRTGKFICMKTVSYLFRIDLLKTMIRKGKKDCNFGGFHGKECNFPRELPSIPEKSGILRLEGVWIESRISNSANGNDLPERD